MKMEFKTSGKRFYIAVTLLICIFSFNYNIASAAFRKGRSGDPTPFSLPLVLLSYDISMNNRNVFMTWVTGQEKKISHFVIERSLNGADYVETGIVVATGNSDIKQNYTYSETLAMQVGVVYYRLKMVDTYGRFQNSQVRLVRTGLDASASMQLQAFPNPAVNQVALTVPARWQSKHVDFYVYNMSGNMVRRVSNNKSNQTETVNLTGLEKGFYMVKASTESETLVQRVMKL